MHTHTETHTLTHSHFWRNAVCVVSGSGGQPSLSGTVSMYSAPIEAGLGAYLFNTGSIHSTGQRLAFGTLTPPE